MLRLSSESTSAWLGRALSDMDTILLDHAHCEKKAASTALSLIFRYQDEAALMLPLSALAREELEHFERVITVLRSRGQEFRRLAPSPYAGELISSCRTPRIERLIDTLICCALIEARSCERMKLLAENLEDPGLARLYRSLLASEARHHQCYLDLAAPYTDRESLRKRTEVLSAHEAKVIAAAPPIVRLHT